MFTVTHVAVPRAWKRFNFPASGRIRSTSSRTYSPYLFQPFHPSDNGLRLADLSLRHHLAAPGDGLHSAVQIGLSMEQNDQRFCSDDYGFVEAQGPNKNAPLFTRTRLYVSPVNVRDRASHEDYIILDSHREDRMEQGTAVSM